MKHFGKLILNSALIVILAALILIPSFSAGFMHYKSSGTVLSEKSTRSKLTTSGNERIKQQLNPREKYYRSNTADKIDLLLETNELYESTQSSDTFYPAF